MKLDVCNPFLSSIIGINYDIDDDILLLDISNNEEYTWTNDFDPRPPTPEATMPPTSKIPSSSKDNKDNKPIIIGAVVGSLFGVIVLSLGALLIYKRVQYQRANQNTTTIQTPGNGETYEVLARRNIDNRRHDITSMTSSVNSAYYEQKVLPGLPVNENTTNNEVYD